MIETRADLVRELRLAKDYGVSAEFLQRNGIASIEACAAELRRSGYEVEVRPKAEGGGKILVLIALPNVGSRERKRDWLQIFDTSEEPRGTYDPE